MKELENATELRKLIDSLGNGLTVIKMMSEGSLSDLSTARRLHEGDDIRYKLMELIGAYLREYRSMVALSLMDIRFRLDTLPVCDTTAVEALCKMVDELEEERKERMLKMVPETWQDVEDLYEEICGHLSDAMDDDYVPKGLDPYESIKVVLYSYTDSFVKNKYSYLLARAIGGAINRDRSEIHRQIKEYVEKRTHLIEVEERERRHEMMYGELKRVNELYKNIKYFVQEALRGEHPQIAIDEAIEKYQMGTEFDSKYWFYLDAIHYMTWSKEHDLDQRMNYIESDIKSFKKRMYIHIAEMFDKEIDYCEYCGEIGIKDDFYEGADDELCCKECFEQRFYVCEDCGGTFRLEDGYRVTAEDNFKICDECYEEDYFQCADCSGIYPNERKNHLEHYDEDVCDDCFNDDYETCSACGAVLHRDDCEYSEYDRQWYCQECYFEAFTCCEECGCEVPRDESIWMDELNGSVCPDCYDSRYGVIHEYHDDVEWDLMLMPEESEDVITIGIEHEVTGPCDHARELNKILNSKKQLAYFFRDGSVSGFEIVSNPMSFRYFYEEFMPTYRKGLEFLKNKGFVGADGGGIHIHFKGLDTQMHIARACNILYGDKDACDAWVKISYRKAELLERWASVKNRIRSTLTMLQSDYKRCSEDRYTALNYDGGRTETHEIRIFNSTLDADEYVSNVEVTKALIEFCRMDIGKGAYVSTRDYLEWMYDNKERFATAFKVLDKREVFENYNIGEVQIPLDFNVGDVELTQQDQEEIEEIVTNLFGIPPITEELINNIVEECTTYDNNEAVG